MVRKVAYHIAKEPSSCATTAPLVNPGKTAPANMAVTAVEVQVVHWALQQLEDNKAVPAGAATTAQALEAVSIA